MYKRYLSSVNFQTEDLEKKFNEGIILQKEIENVLPDNKDAKIIDLGCGFGTFLNELKKKRI